MVKFTDKKYFVKGTCQAQLLDPCTMDVVFSSDAFQTGNITTSLNMGEIRGGLGNGIVAIIPQDSALNVEFTAADFNLAAKAAQLGSSISYGAPVSVCEVVTATSANTLSLNQTHGKPVAPLGYTTPIAYVQQVGENGTVSGTGKAWPVTINTSGFGTIQGITVTTGKKYKVNYFVSSAGAQVVPISSLFDPKIMYFQAQMAVFSKESCAGENEGTRVGWLYVTVPRLKLGGNGGVVGDATNPDTTSISGQALSYDESVISEGCADCEPALYAYYVFVPDNGADSIKGIAVVGGTMSVPKGTSAQIPVRFVMEDGQLGTPGDFKTGFTYKITGSDSEDINVNNEGVVYVLSTATGVTSFTVNITYNNSGTSLTTTVTVNVPA